MQMQKKNEGRWSKAEHRKFLKALEKYGRNWMVIQKKIKTRSLTQIRSHAYKIFMDVPEEDLDAYIGYEGGFLGSDKGKASQKLHPEDQKRVSQRILEKAQRQNLQSQNGVPNPEPMNATINQEPHNVLTQKLLEGSENNSTSLEAKDKFETASPSLVNCQNLGNFNVLGFLQKLEIEEFGGNFMMHTLQQIILNNTLQTLHHFLPR